MPCAKGVRDALQRLDGVRSIDIDLQSNSVNITPAEDRELDLAAIPSAVEGAGFRPFGMHVRGVGNFDVDRPDCFRFRGWSRCYTVNDKPRDYAGGTGIDAGVEVSGRSAELFWTDARSTVPR